MTKTDYIMALNALTTKWVFEKNLFLGGCAYAAAILARSLERMNIKYEVVAYTYGKMNPIKSDMSCSHLAIRVRMGNQRMYIGGNFLHIACPWDRYTINNLGMISSKEVLKYYRSVQKQGHWNDWYNINNNPAFSRLCNNIYKQFSL